ncbi:hypothetical protein ABMB44_14250 [Levilactobacillus brevis]
MKHEQAWYHQEIDRMANFTPKPRHVKALNEKQKKRIDSTVSR